MKKFRDNLYHRKFNRMDDFFIELYECIDQEFEIYRLYCSNDCPDFVKKPCDSAIYFKSKDSNENVTKNHKRNLTLDEEYNNIIHSTVHGLDFSEINIILKIKTKEKIPVEDIEEISTIVRKNLSNILKYRIFQCRDELVAISLRSRDLGSFLHKALNLCLNKFIKFGAASVFFKESHSKSLILGSSTTPIKEIVEYSLKRSDVKYHDDSKSWTRWCFANKESIFEENTFEKRIPELTFGEKINPLINRLYMPIKLRDSFICPDFEKENLIESIGTIGVLRISNISRNGIHVPISNMDYHFLQYFCETVSYLGSRYLRLLTLTHDQEKATHGFITDLSTLRLRMQYLSIHIKKCLKDHKDKGGFMDSKLEVDILAEIDRYSEIFLAVQDGMAFQLATVLEHADGAIGYTLDDMNDKCDQPYTSVIYKVLKSKDAISSSYNRRNPTITYNEKSKKSENYHKMPALQCSERALYLAVRNIFENSIKYTPKNQRPEIDISWHTKGKYFILCISDNGIGMTEEDQDSLFSEGFRSLLAMRTNMRGHGLGLSVSRQAIKRFDGDITYHPRADGNNGSCFCIKVRLGGF